MLLSMTGFGDGVAQANGLAVTVEVRTINSRHFKLNYRSSEGYARLEPDFEALVRENIRRGTVQVNLRVERLSAAGDHRINLEVLRAFKAQLESLQDHRFQDQSVRLDALLALPGVVVERTTISDPHEHWTIIEPAARQALEGVGQMRAEEGRALAADLQENCRAVLEHLDGIAQRSPLVVEDYRQRLTERVNKALAELNVSVEPADLVREVTFFSDRSDISEEIVRLRSHISQFANALALPDSAGRKLEFIAQEMNREINTIGSKANDAQIAERVVEVKAALERIREQIQNVE